MRLDDRIKRRSPDQFRHSLRLEDVVDIEMCDDVIEVVSSADGSVEYAGIFSENPIVYPHMPYGIMSKVQDDQDLEDLVTALLFLNPTIGPEGLIKMAGYIYKYFVYYDDDGEPDLTLDYVNQACATIASNYEDDDDYPIAESIRVILFQNFSTLTKNDKARYRGEQMSKWWRKEIGEFIHKAAIYTVATTPYPKMITHGMIRENTFVVSGDSETGISLNRTIKSRMLSKTVKLLERDGRSRYVSDRQYEKWLMYMEMPKTASLSDMTSKLSISKSTAVQFRNFRGV